MSADKYAQFIGEQQRKLSVSGTNPVNLEEKAELSDKQKKIANLAGDKDKIDTEDLKKLRSKKKDDDDKDDDKDDKDDDDKSDDKDDDDKDDKKPAFMKKDMKEEARTISIEEQIYIDEMVGKGKLNDIADFHKTAANHAYKMTRHHSMMADKSEEVGDHVGYEHHIDRAMQHEYDHEHHLARYDHAAGLKAKNKAMNDLKAAKDKVAKARDAKRDWA